MYHLLIVDDEPNLVDGVSEYLSTVFTEQMDILKAYNAREAEELLKQFAVDIMLLDIQMPGQTGLEFIKKIENLNPKCKVIFLTGHNTFSWIQEALRSPCCVDYILKTQGDLAILEAVQKQLVRIKQELQAQAQMDEKKKEEEKMQMLLQQKVLREWIDGVGEALPEVTNGGICMAEKMQVCLCHCKSKQKNSDVYAMLIQSFLEEELKSTSVEVVYMGWGDLAILLQRKQTEEMEKTETLQLRMRLEKLQEFLKSVGYVSNIAFIEKRIRCEEVSWEVKQMYERLLKTEATEQEMIIDISSENDEKQENDLKSKTSEAKNETEIITWIKQYVKEHISDVNLSVSVIAEKSYYSSAYLSRLFRQEEGQTLITYIGACRINAACEMLIEGKDTIQKISKSVGYESPSYFSAYFKRKMGKTPQQYVREKRCLI